MKTYKARGIVLHTVKYGDSSLIAYLLTDIGGRQTYMIQGVRSTRGRGNKGALFQPMFVLEFEGIESSRAELHRMKEVSNLIPLMPVPLDVRKSTVALFMAEVLYRLIREVEPNSPLFDFVCQAIVALDRMETGTANFHLWFLVRLSAFLGFYPGNEYMPGDCFDIREGVFRPSIPDHRMILAPEQAATLAALMEVPIDSLASIPLGRHQRSDFMSGMLAYFGYHFDSIHEVRSINILREVF